MNLIKVSVANFNKSALKSLLGSRVIHTSSPSSDKTTKTYYEILRVPDDASQTQIKETYYKLCKVYHPDVDKGENSMKMFRSITEAYNVLGNVQSRVQYDKDSGLLEKAMKEAFHPCGYKDRNEWLKMLPDYDEILARKSKQETWEDVQYKKRVTEKQTVKKKLHIGDHTFIWDPADHKLLVFGIIIFSIAMLHHYWDEKYFEKYFDPPPHKKN